MAEEDKTTSAFDRFSKMGAIMGEARLSQEQGERTLGPGLEDFEKGYDLALKLQKNAKAKINKNKEATQKLLDQFPGGISVPKMDEQLDGLVSNFLTEQRGIYETNARIEGQGAKAEGYDAAVGSNNQIDRNVLAVNNDLESFANLRTELLKEIGGVSKDEETGELTYDKPSEYAKGTTLDQQTNLYNLASGDYESLKPQITYNEKGDANLTIEDSKGNRVNINELDLPEVYDNAAEVTYDKLIDSTQELKEKGGLKSKTWEGSVDRRKAVNSIKENFKDEKTIKNYMFEHPDLIDQYMANDQGISVEEVRKDPEYENKFEMFKETSFDVSEVQDLLIKSLDETYTGSQTVSKQTNEIVVQEGDFEPTEISEVEGESEGKSEVEGKSEGGLGSKYNKTEGTEEEEAAQPIGNAIFDNPRINKRGVLRAIKSGELTDKILIKYLSDVPGITIENNEIKGLSTVKPSAFNNAMRKIQEETGIDLDY